MTTSLTNLTSLALERSAQPPTATCPSSLQGCLLWAALRKTDAAIRTNKFDAMSRIAMEFPPAVWQAPPGYETGDGYMLSTFVGGSGGPGDIAKTASFSATPAGHLSNPEPGFATEAIGLCGKSTAAEVARYLR